MKDVMRARQEIDGTIKLTLSDGRAFEIQETDGSFTLESMGGEILLHPVSRSKIEIDTPLT